VLQDEGKMNKGSRLINEAEKLEHNILKPNVLPEDQREFDRLVMFGSLTRGPKCPWLPPPFPFLPTALTPPRPLRHHAQSSEKSHPTPYHPGK
jgi:hypothetical protein